MTFCPGAGLLVDTDRSSPPIEAGICAKALEAKKKKTNSKNEKKRDFIGIILPQVWLHLFVYVGIHLLLDELVLEDLLFEPLEDALFENDPPTFTFVPPPNEPVFDWFDE